MGTGVCQALGSPARLQMVLDGCSVSASWPVSLAQLGNAPSSSWWAASSGLAWITGERVGCKLLESSEGISKPLAWSRQQFGFCSQVQNRSYQAQAVMWSCWKSPWFALECCKLSMLCMDSEHCPWRTQDVTGYKRTELTDCL